MNVSVGRARIGRASVIAIVIAVSLMGLRAPAEADEADAATQASEQIADVAALAGEPLTAENTGVDVPSEGDADISIAGDTGTGTMSIPASGEGATAADGTTVFDGTATDSAIAVQTTASGVRAVIDIQSADAPESYDFTLGGDIASLVLEQDGSVTTLDANGTATGQVAAPWAFDADGKPVPTHYVVSGTTLTQIVEHKGGDFAYGITADPRLTYGWGVYLNMRGWEVRAIASVTYTTGAVASIVACEVTSKLPSILGKLVKVLCVVVGGSSVLSLVKGLTSIAKSKNVDDNSCYQTKVVPPNRELKKVAVSNCTG